VGHPVIHLQELAASPVLLPASPCRWALTEGAKVAAGLIKTAVVEGELSVQWHMHLPGPFCSSQYTHSSQSASSPFSVSDWFEPLLPRMVIPCVQASRQRAGESSTATQHDISVTTSLPAPSLSRCQGRGAPQAGREACSGAGPAGEEGSQGQEREQGDTSPQAALGARWSVKQPALGRGDIRRALLGARSSIRA
jgi:hypothetical protein